MKLTAERLRFLLRYAPETGLFYWRNPSGPRAVAGALAGSESQGYVNISVDGKLYRAHRLAWLYVYGVWPAKQIDHANRSRSDNRIANLRESDQSQNMGNAARRSDCRSGFKGVTAYRSRWVATIRRSGKKVHLGVFDTPEAAHAAYVSAACDHFGEFARAA